jgi:hypothetical protein
MKEPDGEDLASHTGPESCEGGSNVALEALTGVRAGWVLSPVMSSVQGADEFLIGGRPHGPPRYREGWTGPAGSKTPCTHGRTSQGGGDRPRRRTAHFGDGSREIPGSTSAAAGVRIVNPRGTRR